MADESLRTILVALGAGVGVALAKAGAAAFTGSSALAAEAAHSIADTANDVFLFVAQRRSGRAVDGQHPLGYGREAYFWALIAALGVFVAGAAFSLREGIDELIHPSATTSYGVAYAVLAISTVFDLASFRQSTGQLRRRARRHERGFVEESRVTSDPTLRAVFLEDTVAVGGNLITLVALGLNQVTGSSLPQGVAAVVLALVLIRVSLRLIRRSHDFLVGVWKDDPGAQDGGRAARITQPFNSLERGRIRAFLVGYPGVADIRELLVTFLGPGRVWIVARVDIVEGLSGDQVTALVSGIECGLLHAEEEVYRVDVVAVGGAPASRA